jgi:hypothetical protein
MKSEKFKLKRTTQCAKCPWKVSTNPYDIPDGKEVTSFIRWVDDMVQDDLWGIGRQTS